MPDTPELREHFGQSGQQVAGCGFPTAHWLALVHFGSGLFQQVIACRAADARSVGHGAAASRTRGGRRAGRRPRLLLVCPSGAVVWPGRACGRASPSAADRRLQARPALRCAWPRQKRKEERPAALPLDRAAWSARSARRMVSAGRSSGLDVGRQFCSAAPDAARARAGIRDRATRFSCSPSDARHDAVGFASLHQAAIGGGLRLALDNRNLLRPFEDHA